MKPIEGRQPGKPDRRIGDRRAGSRRQSDRTANALRPARFWLVTSDDIEHARHAEIVSGAYFHTAHDAANYVIDNTLIKRVYTLEVIVRHVSKR